MNDPERLSEHLDGLLLAAGVRLDRLWGDDEAEDAVSLDEGRVARPGTVLAGRYKLEAVLGEGTFGRVWKAVHVEEERPVAVKELKRDPAGSEEVLLADTESQLAQEFFTLSRLGHPNIVEVSDYGELDDGGRFLVMELVPGQDVQERLAHGPLPQEEAAQVLVGLLLGLQLLHSRLYVHGDVKAENVRVTPEGRVKLMDFGLLHQLGTPATQLQGTLEYMAPEVMQGGVIDGRTDLYSAGVLAYELFTGSLPFSGESVTELLQKHLRETPLPPSHYLDLDEEVDRFVLKLLAKRPEERYPDVAAALEDLAPLAGELIDTRALSHTTSYLYSADLIGRDEERARLEATRADVLAGRGPRMFIGGRGGEGKTRLLEELRLKAKLDGLLWAGGQCREVGGAPRGPIVQALSTLAARCDDEELGEDAPLLATLLPELEARGVVAARPPDPVKAKELLLEALVRWLERAARAWPAAICLEDLHWADGGTVELFNHLLRNVSAEVPLAFVGTLRTNEVDATHQVLSTVHEGRTELLELSPLAPAHVAELLESTLPRFEPPAPFVEELHRKSGGNAFFLVETLRWLVEAGHLATEDAGFALDDEPPPAGHHPRARRAAAGPPAARAARAVSVPLAGGPGRRPPGGRRAQPPGRGGAVRGARRPGHPAVPGPLQAGGALRPRHDPGRRVPEPRRRGPAIAARAGRRAAGAAEQARALHRAGPARPSLFAGRRRPPRGALFPPGGRPGGGRRSAAGGDPALAHQDRPRRGDGGGRGPREGQPRAPPRRRRAAGSAGHLLR